MSLAARLALAFCWLAPLAALAQRDAPVLGLEAGDNAVGFQLLEERDASRIVTGGVAETGRARPVRVYVWYPARRGAQPVTFGRYAALADEDIWPAEIAGASRAHLQYSRRALARSLSPNDFQALLRRPMRASENAEPETGPFPLIALGQGLYYESPVALAALAEYLAGHGFVVATTPLVGTNSPLIKLDTQDLDNQVRDLELVVAHARERAFVDGERLGVLGFDMGGMAGVLLAMRNPDVDAFASLDAGILFEHESGLPRRSPGYDPAALRIPWLHATPPRGVRPPSPAADSLVDTAIYSERYLLVTAGMGHVDFTSYALVEDRRAMTGYWPEPGAVAGVEGHKAVARHVLRFFAAYLSNDAASREALSAAPEVSGARMTLEHRAAAPAPIGYDELVSEVVAGRAADAVAQLRAAAATAPNHLLLEQLYLQRLAQTLLFTWGLGEEALPVIELLIERYPESVSGRFLLGEAHVLRGDHAAAIAAYERILEEFPGDAGAKARLESLRSAPRN
jgi:tetratricopeptide (TPR) repeat protein